MAKVNPIKKVLVIAKTEADMTDYDIAQFLGKSREVVCRHINKNPDGWTLGLLKKYVEVLDIEADDILDAIGGYLYES